MSINFINSSFRANITNINDSPVHGTLTNKQTKECINFTVHKSNALNANVLGKIIEGVAHLRKYHQPKASYQLHLKLFEKDNIESAHFVRVDGIGGTKSLLEISSIKGYSFSSFTRKIEDITFEEFQSNLQSYPLVVADLFETSIVASQSQTDEQEDEEEIEIPSSIEYTQVLFHLSNELVQGMKGLRDEDHHISYETLDYYLKKKIKTLIKQADHNTERRFIFDIPVTESKAKNHLRLVIDHYLDSATVTKPHFTVISGFYVSISSKKPSS